MEPKDIATLSVSGIALLLSAIAFVVSYVRGRDEKRRGIRQQITETIGKISSSSLESMRLRFGEAKDNPAMQEAIDNILGQQIGALLNQAEYLARLAPKLMTPVHFNTIALVSASTGDQILADRNYQNAIDASTDDFSRFWTTRSYAAYLFPQGRAEPAREKFRKAVGFVKATDDQAKWHRGATYRAWCLAEMNFGGPQNHAQEAYEGAIREFNGIENLFVRQTAMIQMAPLTAHVVPQSPPAPGVVQPAVWS